MVQNQLRASLSLNACVNKRRHILPGTNQAKNRGKNTFKLQQQQRKKKETEILPREKKIEEEFRAPEKKNIFFPLSVFG